MYEQLTLPLDFATIEINTNERNTNGNLDSYNLSA